MSEIAGQTGLRAGATAVVHESYSFACMQCGHGWEQSYEIEHHTDAKGQEFVLYVADGQVVPSPLSRPTCPNCDNHVVRIMRPGRVASAREAAHRHDRVPPAGPAQAPKTQAEAEAGKPKEDHHWHLSDLLHPFQRKAS
jgi:Zn finger protein HypA/HybF involved in hydrogenase expression